MSKSPIIEGSGINYKNNYIDCLNWFLFYVLKKGKEDINICSTLSFRSPLVELEKKRELILVNYIED